MKYENASSGSKQSQIKQREILDREFAIMFVLNSIIT